MSESTAVQESYIKIIDLTEERFKKVAAPSIKYDSEKGFAIQLLQTKPELMKAFHQCPESLASAVVNIATIGLSLNPAKKEAYLITRNFKLKDAKGQDFWQTRICLEPSYMGMCNLATNTGSVLWVQAKPVHEKDTYLNNGTDQAPTHTYEAFRDRGPIIGYYCVAKTSSNAYLTTEMSIAEVEKVRGSSESFKKGFGPWVDWPEEQAKKTVVRRAFKLWPKTDQFSQLEQAIEISNDNEGFEPLLTAPRLNTYNSEQKAYFDSLIEKGDSLGMYVLQCTIEESVFSNLYNSFEKGTVTKYKKIVGDMLSRGANTMADCVTAVRDAVEASDETGAKEIAEVMSQDAINIIKSRLTAAQVSEFNAITKGE